MGSRDIPLNENGVKQSEEASVILAHESFDIIVSSSSMRAQKTAEIIAKKTNKPIMFNAGLVERVWGEAEGKPFDSSLHEDDHTPPGAETFYAFQLRVMETISSILLMEKLPLIVSHGGVLKVLGSYFGHKDLNSSNCIPFFFRPPDKPIHPWLICDLSGEDL